MNVFIAYGFVPYEGNQTLTIADNYGQAMDRCQKYHQAVLADENFELPIHYMAYSIATWTVGALKPDAVHHVTPEELK